MKGSDYDYTDETPKTTPYYEEHLLWLARRPKEAEAAARMIEAEIEKSRVLAECGLVVDPQEFAAYIERLRGYSQGLAGGQPQPKQGE